MFRRWRDSFPHTSEQEERQLFERMQQLLSNEELGDIGQQTSIRIEGHRGKLSTAFANYSFAADEMRRELQD